MKKIIIVMFMLCLFGCGFNKTKVIQTPKPTFTSTYVMSCKDSLVLIVVDKDQIITHINNYKGKVITEAVVTGNKFDFISSNKNTIVDTIHIYRADKSESVIKVGDRINKDWIIKIMYPYTLIN